MMSAMYAACLGNFRRDTGDIVKPDNGVRSGIGAGFYLAPSGQPIM